MVGKNVTLENKFQDCDKTLEAPKKSIPQTKSNRFAIALSFASEYRDKYIEPIANELAIHYKGKAKILYDGFHQSEFARPNLDQYLPDLYRLESDLIVVFIAQRYNEKSWCGLELNAIKDFLLEDQGAHSNRLMFMRVGEGDVNGFYGRLTGSIDIQNMNSQTAAQHIIVRHEQVLKAMSDSSLILEKEEALQSDHKKASNNDDFKPTVIAAKVLDIIRSRYNLADNSIYTFAQKVLRDKAAELITPEKASGDFDYVVARILLDYSKSALTEHNNIEAIPHYICDAINLFEKDKSDHSDMISECIKLKVAVHSMIGGSAHELMVDLLLDASGQENK